MITHENVVRATLDIASVAVVAGTLVNLLPAIAAVVSIIWGCLRIYETKTVQRWLGKN